MSSVLRKILFSRFQKLFTGKDNMGISDIICTRKRESSENARLMPRWWAKGWSLHWGRNETQDSTEDTASIHVLFVQRDKSDLIRSYYTNHLPYHVASACHGWVECTSLKREAAIWCIEGKGVQWIQWNLSKFNRGLPRINKFDGKVHFINIIFLYILETILLKINRNWYLIWNSKLHRNQMKEYSTEHSKCILQNTINWTAILDFISLYFIILYNLIFTA